MRPELTDAELATGLLQRRERALAAVQDKHGSRVSQIIWSRIRGLGDTDDLQDLLQEWAIKVWYGIDKFDPAHPNGSFAKWLNQLAKGVGSQFRRKRIRRRNLLTVFARVHHGKSLGGAQYEDARLDHATLVAIIAAAVGDLSPVDRRILRAHLSGLDATAIGASVALAPGAVRVRLTRLRKRLAERARSAGLSSLIDQFTRP